MKPGFLLLLLPLLLAGCEKNVSKSTDDTDIPGLPPITQTGANRLGFLLNGVPWTPQGNSGTANLSMDFDPGFNNGILGIAAYRKNEHDDFFISLGIKDSLNFIKVPQTYKIGKAFLGGIYFRDKFLCERYSENIEEFSFGSITITKLDRRLGVIAGTLEVTLYNPRCGDTIHITKGRFDMGF